jgi:GntR family transcriptional regulator / MocR family aminotransferase
MSLDESSQPVDVLLSVTRGGSVTLGRQIEDRLRQAIRDGALRPDAQLPSTRDLSRQLGVSRRVVVDAYAQLAAEGYLSIRQGARPRVSTAAARSDTSASETPAPPVRMRFDLRPSMPDISIFPRRAWLRSLGEAVRNMSDEDLGYGDLRGVETLRSALADYLGRARGVVCAPEHILITAGYTQGLSLVCQALADRGCKRIAVEDPSNPEDWAAITRVGLEPIPVMVDALGARTDELAQSDAGAAVLTPAHQHPSGVVLSGERRTALLGWLRERQAFAIEDDYDAEYRYDRAAVGSLQGLDPERVIYAGSLSKTLAPALRIGWLALPPTLVEPVSNAKLRADRGTNAIEQYALADFLVRGELDRHIRRMRVSYRRRRDALLEAVSRALPEATVTGVAAGLHLVVSLPEDDERAIRAEAERRLIELETMNEYRWSPHERGAVLLLGYGRLPEPAIPAAVDELAGAVRDARSSVR